MRLVKTAGVEDDPIDPVLHEGVGAHLHAARGTTGVPLAGERSLQMRRLGRRAAPSSVPITPVRQPSCSKNRLQEVRRRRLAVRAGDPDGAQRRGGLAVEGARGPRHRRSAPCRAGRRAERRRGFGAEGVLADERDRIRRGGRQLRSRGRRGAHRETAEQRRPGRPRRWSKAIVAAPCATRVTEERRAGRPVRSAPPAPRGPTLDITAPPLVTRSARSRDGAATGVVRDVVVAQGVAT